MYSIGDTVILRNCRYYNISAYYNDKIALIVRFYTEKKLSYLIPIEYNTVVQVLEDGSMWHINTKDLTKISKISKIIKII